MKKNFLFFKKSLFLTALLCLGIIRSAAQDAAPTVKSGWRAELGLFMPVPATSNVLLHGLVW